METITEVANLALSHLGHGKPIASLSENSDEARACNMVKDLVRKTTLKEAPWGFARTEGELSLIEEFTTGEWRFSYTYPPTALAFRRIKSSLRTDSQDSRVPFVISTNDDGETIILTDADEAEGVWTQDVSTVTKWSVDFIMALSYRWAALIAARVTKGDLSGLGPKATQMAEVWVGKAIAASLNEIQPDTQPASEFERSRE